MIQVNELPNDTQGVTVVDDGRGSTGKVFKSGRAYQFNGNQYGFSTANAKDMAAKLDSYGFRVVGWETR